MNSRGFTLIELVVTLAVLTIMMAIALPATSGWRKNAQYKETTRDVVSLLRRARSLAVRQNQIISVTIDPANRKYSLNGAETILPKGVEVEVKEKDTDTWQQAISETINFRPQEAQIKPFLFALTRTTILR